MHKEGSKKILEYLRIRFNGCLFEAKVPKQCNNAVAILIYKKGELLKLDNYRRISVLSQICKTFTESLTD